MDLYNILGITKDADSDTVIKAYRQLAKKYHPDSNSGKRFPEWDNILIAYQVLKNGERRKKYDETGTIDDSKNNFHSRQLSFLADLFNRCLEDSIRSNLDVFVLLRTGINKDLNSFSTQLSVLQKKVKKLKSIRSKIRKNKKVTKKDDFFISLIDEKIKGILQKTDSILDLTEMLNGILEMTEGYSIDSKNDAEGKLIYSIVMDMLGE